MLKTICTLLAFSPGLAQAGEFLFDINANGFRYGEFTVALNEDAPAYSVHVVAQAQGLFGFVIRAKYSGTSSGNFSPDGARVTKTFNSRSSRIFTDRTSQVTFEKGHPVSVIVNPAKRRTALSDPTRIAGKVLDPLSYLASLLTHKIDTCPAEQRLYDGRRITRVSFSEAVIEGERLTCQGRYEIVEGPDHSVQKGVRRFGVLLVYGRAVKTTLKSVEITSGNNVILLHRLGD